MPPTAALSTNPWAGSAANAGTSSCSEAAQKKTSSHGVPPLLVHELCNALGQFPAFAFPLMRPMIHDPITGKSVLYGQDILMSFLLPAAAERLHQQAKADPPPACFLIAV